MLFSLFDSKVWPEALRGRRIVVLSLTSVVLLVLSSIGPSSARAMSRADLTAGTSVTPQPIRAAFYYPWFPEAERWATRYQPVLGKYDSSDRAVLETHVSHAKYAGLDAFISSYWGRNSRTAQRLPILLDAARAQDFHIAAYYEPESMAVPPDPAGLRADFDVLFGHAADPAWLRVGGKPVLFIYNTGSEASCSAVPRLKQASAGRFYLNLKVFPGYRTCADQPDSWHQYGPAVGYDQQSSYSATVSPGFYKFNEQQPRLMRSLTRFKADVARQVRSGAQWHLITSFNEWGEGTAVEPAKTWPSTSAYGSYLDALRSAYC